MDEYADYRIRFRARELWEQSGEPNGSSLAFWLAAEAELKSEQEKIAVGVTPCAEQAPVAD